MVLRFPSRRRFFYWVWRLRLCRTEEQGQVCLVSLVLQQSLTEAALRSYTRSHYHLLGTSCPTVVAFTLYGIKRFLQIKKANN